LTPAQPGHPSRSAQARRPAHKHRTIQFSRSFTCVTPGPLAASRSEDGLYTAFFVCQPGVKVSFQAPVFDSADRDPEAATRKTNEQALYHGSATMQTRAVPFFRPRLKTRRNPLVTPCRETPLPPSGGRRRPGVPGRRLPAGVRGLRLKCLPSEFRQVKVPALRMVVRESQPHV